MRSSLRYRSVPLTGNRLKFRDRVAGALALFGSRVTQGPRVKKFEKTFLDVVHASEDYDATMVNSGSSANLLMAARLAQIRPAVDYPEVVMPALTWPTTVAPFIQYGYKPVFVDVDSSFTLDPNRVEEAVSRRTAAVVAVHLLGTPCDMQALYWARKEMGLTWVMLEDCCEALGTKGLEKWRQNHKSMASYSFYWSHHVCTIEGGMLLHPAYAEEVKAMREHGWIRHYSRERRDSLAKSNEDLDSTWMFDQLGYNLRSTEVAAAIGLSQLPRLDEIVRGRRRVVAWLDAAFVGRDVFRRDSSRDKDSSFFGYPVIIPENFGASCKEIRSYLEERGIETRPIISGNITRHPWYMRNPSAWRIHGELGRTNRIHENGFMIPCHEELNRNDVEYIENCFDEILRYGVVD